MSLTPDQARVVGEIWNAKSPYELGVIAERERIIELIPEYMKTVLDWGHETASEQLVALIKKANK